MATNDQSRWDERYNSHCTSDITPALPSVFEPFAGLLAGTTAALELACGMGSASVWLALQGAQVSAYDISPVAIDGARQLAMANDVADRCSFDTADFDHGLPGGGPVDLVLCHMFRDHALDAQIWDRLHDDGLLAIAVLSEVGASPGRFRVAAGQLVESLAAYSILGHGEGDGVAWLVGRKKL